MDLAPLLDQPGRVATLDKAGPSEKSSDSRMLEVQKWVSSRGTSAKLGRMNTEATGVDHNEKQRTSLIGDLPVLQELNLSANSVSINLQTSKFDQHTALLAKKNLPADLLRDVLCCANGWAFHPVDQVKNRLQSPPGYST